MILYLLLRFLLHIQIKRNGNTFTISQHSTPPPEQVQKRTQRQKEQEQHAIERQKRQDERRAAQIEQAELDAPFYKSQLDDYTRLHRDAQRLYEAAQSEVDTDDELNKYGAVVSIKTYSKHVAMRDRYKKAVLMYERQIHTAQKNLDKAKRILNQAGDS